MNTFNYFEARTTNLHICTYLVHIVLLYLSGLVDEDKVEFLSALNLERFVESWERTTLEWARFQYLESKL